jgi:integrase
LSKQVKEGKITAATMQGIQVVARGFIRDRWAKRFIELPRNLTARNLAADVPLQQVEVFSKEEITQLMGKASDRKRLYLLLMLNCGMYPSDIAALKQSEVDWTAGRLARQRTKTKGQSGNVPKVDYPLWRATLDLLNRCRSSDPNLVLLNNKGKPLWRWVEKKGKRYKLTNIAVAYFQLQEAIGIPKESRKPLKSLRKTASSMLENHAEYGRYAQYFLGHAPRSVADRHYVQPSRTQFDAAIKWLGQQLGIE